MSELPNDVFALFALVCAMGLKHGLDPDHLATIDGLIRFNSSTKPWLAKWAGVFFSIGHGLVVTVVIATVALIPASVALPAWLKEFGAAVSILVLLLLGILNLYAAFRNQNAEMRPMGIKSWMHFKSGHPAIVLGIGALFAVSFDTMSHAAFFALAASHVSFELYAFTLGIAFTVGMIISDGINGILTARFIRKSGERSMIASRVMCVAIGSMSLLIALIAMSRLSMPAVSEKIEDLGVWTSIVVLIWVTAGFLVSIYITQIATLSKRIKANLLPRSTQ